MFGIWAAMRDQCAYGSGEFLHRPRTNHAQTSVALECRHAGVAPAGSAVTFEFGAVVEVVAVSLVVTVIVRGVGSNTSHAHAQTSH